MPQSPRCLFRAPFETRHRERRERLLPEPPVDRWARLAKATASPALLRTLADPPLRDLAISPDELGPDTLVIVG